MAFCTSCGKQVADGSKFCTGCGKPLGGAPAGGASSNQWGPGPWSSQGSGATGQNNNAYAQNNTYTQNNGNYGQAGGAYGQGDNWGASAPQKSGKLSTGATVGIIIGAVFLAIAVAVGAYFLVKHFIANDDEQTEEVDAAGIDSDGYGIPSADGANQNGTQDGANGGVNDGSGQTPSPFGQGGQSNLSIDERNRIVEAKYNEYASQPDDLTGTYLEYGYDDAPRISYNSGVLATMLRTEDSGLEIGYCIKLEEDSVTQIQRFYLCAWTADENGQLCEEKAYFENAGIGNGYYDQFEYAFYEKNGLIIAESRGFENMVDFNGLYGLEVYCFEPGDGIIRQLGFNNFWPNSSNGLDIVAGGLDDFGMNATANKIRATGIFGIVREESLNPLVSVCAGYKDIGRGGILVKQVTDARGEHIFLESSSRLLMDEELWNLSPDELRYARNEIYARHGRLFKDTELQTIFNNTFWYNGYSQEISESAMSDIEKKNLRKIQQYE